MKPVLRRKVLLAQAPVGVVLALVGLLAVGTLDYLSRESAHILEDNFRTVLAAQRIVDAIDGIDTAALLILAGERQRGLDQAAEFRPMVTRELAQQDHEKPQPGEADAVKEMRDLWASFQPRFDEFLSVRETDQARNRYFSEIEPILRSMKSGAELVLGLNQDAMVAKNDEVNTVGSRVVALMTLASIVAFAIGSYLSVLLTGRLLAPLQQLGQAARRIGEGDLDARADVRGNDEIGSLAADFNHMAQRLKDYRNSSLGELLQAQLALLSAIDSLTDPIVVLGIDGKPTTVNKAAEGILGLPADVSGRDPLAGVDPDIRQAITELGSHVLTGKGAVAPKSFADAMRVQRDADVHYLLPRAAAVYEPGSGIVGATIVFQDVTRLRLFDELKNDMMATVAHEFRTPLTSLRMAVHLCIEEVAGPLTEKQADLLQAAREECERLQNMVDDLLDLSRLESGRAPLSLEPEDLMTAIEPAVDAALPAATARDVTLDLDLPPIMDPVMIDRDRLTHVFGNLIDNAVAHSPKGGTVTVRAHPMEDGMMLCSVTDQGPGIAAQHQARIFDKFYRLPDIEPHGAGLGLSIAREVVLAHGGTIGVTSEEGRGATFWFTVPIVPADKPAEASSTADAG